MTFTPTVPSRRIETSVTLEALDASVDSSYGSYGTYTQQQGATIRPLKSFMGDLVRSETISEILTHPSSSAT